LGRIAPRGKLSGRAFIQDKCLPGMLHGRVIRGHNPAAPKDQRTASTYIFGAICPRLGRVPA
jgi:hypothetical protein